MSTVDDLRELALALPESSERRTWGMPTFRVRDKIFASIHPQHGAGVKISREERGELAAAEPAKFYWTAHDEKFSMMRLHLAVIARDELAELVTDAWRFTAPKSLVDRFEG